MNQPENIDWYEAGCARDCSEQHTYTWGRCALAPESARPEPTISIGRVETMSDGYPGIVMRSVPLSAWDALLTVAKWVSRGKSFALDADPEIAPCYPDASARRALGALHAAGLLTTPAAASSPPPNQAAVKRIADTITPFLANFSDEETARVNAREVAAAVLSELLPPADRAAVRDRIVTAIKTAPFEELRTVGYAPNGPLQITIRVEELADAILRAVPAAVSVPPPTRADDRADVLREAADALPEADLPFVPSMDRRRVADWLRRRAAEAQQPECPGYEAVPNLCACPCEGCKHHCGAHNPAEAQQQQPEAENVAQPCDGCGHPEHPAHGCPVTLYGERCACDEPVAAGTRQQQQPAPDPGRVADEEPTTQTRETECAHCWRLVENRGTPNMGGPPHDNWVHVPGGFQPCFPQKPNSPRAEPRS